MNNCLKINDSVIWNQKNLDSPPLVTFDYPLSEYNKLFKDTNFNLIFFDHVEKTINLFNKSKILFLNEKSLLEKIIYKNWNPLRKENSLKLMKQLKRIINSFIDLKLDSLLVNIKETSQTRDQTFLKNITNNKLIKTLPSREIFEYFLVRLVSSHQLLEYGMNLIKSNILIHIMKSIKNAIYLPNNILFMSNLSRLYCFLKKYNQMIILIYNNLRDYINLFKSTSIKWSKSFNLDELPSHLSDNKLKNKKDVNNFNSNECIIDIINQPNFMVKNDLVEDLGEKIDRDLYLNIIQNTGEQIIDNSTSFESNNKLLTKKIIKLIRLSSSLKNKKSKKEQEKTTKKFNLKLFRKKFRKYLLKNVINSNCEYMNYLLVNENMSNFKNNINKLIVKKFNYLNEKQTKKLLKSISNSFNKNIKK